MKTFFDTLAAVVVGLAFTALPIDLSALRPAVVASSIATADGVSALWAGPLAGPVAFLKGHSDAIKALIILLAAACHVALLLAEARKARTERAAHHTLRMLHLAMVLWSGLVALQVVLIVEHGLVVIGTA